MHAHSPRKHTLFRFSIRLLVLLAAFSALVVYHQEWLLFPYARFRPDISAEQQAFPPDADGESWFRFDAHDHAQLEVWRKAGAAAGPLKNYAVLFFRGNGGPLESFRPFQKLFTELGANTYLWNYRAYGRSSGALTEAAMLEDSANLGAEVLRREAITPQHLILVGYSIGTGFAAYAATVHHPALLVLFAPYSSIPDAAFAQPLAGYFYRILAPFLRWNAPSKDFVSQLHKTALLLIHGGKDSLLPISGSLTIEKHYSGSYLRTIYPPQADHNNLLFVSEEQIRKELLAWSQRAN